MPISFRSSFQARRLLTFRILSEIRRPIHLSPVHLYVGFPDLCTLIQAQRLFFYISAKKNSDGLHVRIYKIALFNLIAKLMPTAT